MSITSIDDQKITVGLDVGDRRVHACFLDADGEIVEEARLAATAQALRRRFGSGDHHRVVLEAGQHSPWMSRILIDLGHEVYVANPRRLKAIYLNENKRDKVDAEFLARIGRVDPTLLSPLTHRSAATQTDLALLRSRAAVVRARALLINLRARGREVDGRPHSPLRCPLLRAKSRTPPARGACAGTLARGGHHRRHGCDHPGIR